MNESTDHMDPGTIKQLIDTAATQSDRWLFIALLVIGIFVVWSLFKYFTSELRIRDGKHEELNKFVRDEHSTLVTKCTAALESNTKVIEGLAQMNYNNNTRSNHNNGQ